MARLHRRGRGGQRWACGDDMSKRGAGGAGAGRGAKQREAGERGIEPHLRHATPTQPANTPVQWWQRPGGDGRGHGGQATKATGCALAAPCMARALARCGMGGGKAATRTKSSGRRGGGSLCKAYNQSEKGEESSRSPRRGTQTRRSWGGQKTAMGASSALPVLALPPPPTSRLFILPWQLVRGGGEVIRSKRGKEGGERLWKATTGRSARILSSVMYGSPFHSWSLTTDASGHSGDKHP